MKQKLLAGVSLLAACLIAGNCSAADLERQKLTLLLDQLQNVRELAQEAQAVAAQKPDARYSFDYPQLMRDLDSVKTGIDAYLTPARAQPRIVKDFKPGFTLDAEDAKGSY
jgi:RAQPRD family integrative conjugative element protein